MQSNISEADLQLKLRQCEEDQRTAASASAPTPAPTPEATPVLLPESAASSVEANKRARLLDPSDWEMREAPMHNTEVEQLQKQVAALQGQVQMLKEENAQLQARSLLQS